jgi:predicted Holliday junction resolvase-like endonuclease
MPALFAFGFASESKLIHRMHEVAAETQHAKDVVEWHDERHQQQLKASSSTNASSLQRELELEATLTKLYRESVETGVRVVKGDLSMHQRALNYFNDNPVKVLLFMGIPTVGYIFYGRSSQEHLSSSMKLMHTRVMGQGATIVILLSLMGFKEYMNKNGKYITEEEAEMRVQEMKRVRAELLTRMEENKQALQHRQEEIQKAHEADVREGHVHDAEPPKSNKKKKKKSEVE